MSRSKFAEQNPEMAALLETEQHLLARQKEFAEMPRKLAQERKEQESTMPPLLEIEERTRRIQHEELVSRGQVSNILRDQSRSLLLTFLLLIATGALIWWGIKLMQS
jgi:hypothetical protein